MKLTKHWHYLVILITLIVINSVVNRTFENTNPGILYITSPAIVVGFLVIIVAWIVFAFSKKKKKELPKEEEK